MKKRILTSIMGVVFIATLFKCILITSPVNAAVCSNLNVVFARGSSQNYSVPPGKDINFPSWSIQSGKIKFDDLRLDPSDANEPAFVTKEKESAAFFQTIGNRVLQDYPQLSMQFVSLHDFAGKYNANGYRAVSAFGSLKTAFISGNAIDARFGYSSLIADATNDTYRQSVNDGAEELAGYLEDEALRCPNQLTVLGGFSQGAQVVGDAMQLLHNRGDDILLSRLGHVDLFGDPRFNGFERSGNRFNPLQAHTAYPWVRGSATVNEVGALGPRKPYVPDVLTAQTTSWCDIHDVVCEGITALSADPEAHGHVYNESGGWIEKNGGETYSAIKNRLGLLAGLTDTSANSPFAYWPATKAPSKLDVMFVMDETGDENLSLVPDQEYLARNFMYLADPTGGADSYSSIQAGVVTYTEFSHYNGSQDVIVPSVKTIVNLTSDLYSENSYFKTEWGKEHFSGNNTGGVDQQDSPYSALQTALNGQAWRSDARKVIVVFSNSWGKASEPVSGLTATSISELAKQKGIAVLPVFTSKTMYNTLGIYADPYLAEARGFWSNLAALSHGEFTEVSAGITEQLVYNVIMKHTYQPEPKITLGEAYGSGDTTSLSGATAGKPIAIRTGTPLVLSANTSSSPKNALTSYSWDVNGDGTFDQTSSSPYVTHTYTSDFDGTVTLKVTDKNGDTQTAEQEVIATSSGPALEPREPATTPEITATRSGNTVLLNWAPEQGTILFSDPEGTPLFTADGLAAEARVQNVPPQTELMLQAQIVKDGAVGDALTIVSPVVSPVLPPSNTPGVNDVPGVSDEPGTPTPQPASTYNPVVANAPGPVTATPGTGGTPISDTTAAPGSNTTTATSTLQPAVYVSLTTASTYNPDTAHQPGSVQAVTLPTGQVLADNTSSTQNQTPNSSASNAITTPSQTALAGSNSGVAPLVVKPASVKRFGLVAKIALTTVSLLGAFTVVWVVHLGKRRRF